jgi:flagella basal body P-ring formation protein FlgA
MKTLLQRLAVLLPAAISAMMLQVPAAAQAPSIQSAASIHQAVEQFVRQQTSGLPGKASYNIGAIDPRVALPACAAPEAFLPPGARLWGQSNVGVRCSGAAQWTIYVGVDVRVSGTYLATARALAPGQSVGTDDIVTQAGELTQLPQGVLVNPENAIGKITLSSLAAGQPLRHDILRAPLAVQQGQTVKLLSGGNGFRVSAEGRALSNAQDGQVAQVRTGSGQTVSGVARSGGTVEIGF